MGFAQPTQYKGFFTQENHVGNLFLIRAVLKRFGLETICFFNVGFNIHCVFVYRLLFSFTLTKTSMRP